MLMNFDITHDYNCFFAKTIANKQVGSAAAYFQTGQFFGNRFLKLLVSSIFIIAWVNLRLETCLL